MAHLILSEGRTVVFNEAFNVSVENQKAIANRIMEFIKSKDFQANEIIQLNTNNGSGVFFNFFCPTDCNQITVTSIH
jgi:hypothetical protein